MTSPDGPNQHARERETDGSMPSFTALITFAVKASIFLNVLALGMSSRPGDAMYLLRRPALLLRSLLAMNVAMPLFAAVLAVAFEGNIEGMHPVATQDIHGSGERRGHRRHEHREAASTRRRSSLSRAGDPGPKNLSPR